MATDYRAALMNSLDPDQQKKQPDFGAVMGPDPGAAEPGGLSGAGDLGGGGAPQATGLGQLGGEIGGMEKQPQGGQMPDAIDPSQGAPTLAGQPSGGGDQPWNKARGFLVGFDTDKLNDPNSGAADGSKYTPAAKAFGKIAQSVGISRGNLGTAVDAAKQMGFQNAKAVGDDKIDFGDGNGPVDVIRSDGQIVFQNTTGNPTWEGAHGGGGGMSAPAGGGGGSDSGINSLLTNSDPYTNIQQAIGKYSDSSDYLRQLMAALGGAQ